MPQMAAAAVVGWLGLAGTAATIVTAALTLVFTVGINAALSKVMSGKQRQPGGGSGLSAREVTVRGTVEPRQLIYGEVRVAGTIAFYGLSNHGSQLWFVVVYAGHQCQEISDIWLGPQLIPSADINGTTGEVTTAEFLDESSTSRLHIWKHLGTSAQTVDANMTAAFADWDSNHRGRGIAYVVYRLWRNDEVFPSGAPDGFFALVKGRRVYDPRLDSTNGGSGSHRYTDATTWAWSQNSVLCRRDYLTGGSICYDVATPDPRLGLGESNARIDDAYTIASANIADEDVLIPPASPTTEQKRYTVDTQLSCADTHRENVQILESADNGHTAYVNGKYRLYVGAYDAPTIDLDENDILGPVEVVTHPNGEDLYNLVSGSFFDEDRNWQLSDFPTQTSSSYQTDDGGLKSRTVQMRATRSNYRAQRNAIQILRQSRRKMMVRFTALSPKAIDIAEWDTFRVSIAELGFSNQILRCLEWSFDCATGFISITARDEASSSYTDPAVADYTDPLTNDPAILDIEEPDAPISLTATPTVDGTLLRWTMPSPFNSRTRFAVYQHTSSTPFSSATRVWEGVVSRAEIRHDDVDPKYYWVVSELNGMATTYPAGAGVEGRVAELGIWVARGNCVSRGSIAQKVGGSSAWDSDVHSRAGYTTCHVKFKANANNIDVAVGFSADPILNQSYTSLRHCWVPAADGNVYAYSNGSPIGGGAGLRGAYTAATEFAITYDGSNARYYKDRILTDTVADVGLTFFADSSFYTPGAAVNSLQFGPGTSLETVDTPEIGDEAVTESVSVESATDFTLTSTYTDLSSASVVVPSGQTWRLSVEATASVALGSTPSGACRLMENGVQVQELKGWNSNMTNLDIEIGYTHVVSLGAGTHTFTIQGRNTSGGATKLHAIVKITPLKK